MAVVGSRQSSNDGIFYLCTLFQGNTEGIRDLKSETSACLLERVISLSEGFRAGCFFCYSPPLRSTLLIKDHAQFPRRVLQHYNSSPQVQLSGSFTFSYPFPSPPLSSSLLSLHLLSSSVSSIRRPSFHVLPTPYSVRSFYFLLPLPHYPYFGRAQYTPYLHSSFPPSSSHLPSAYASAYFETVAHNRYSILMRTLMNF